MQFPFTGRIFAREYPIPVSLILIAYRLVFRLIVIGSRKRVFTFIFLILFKLSFSQGPVDFRHLTVENGLSNNWVKCILKDSRGFMWFGTSNGLNRYDGIEFKVFKREINDPLSLSNNTVTDIFEDSRGNMWVTTEKGLNVYNRQTENFYSYLHMPDNPLSLGSNATSKVLEDLNGRIWIGTSDGLDSYLPETKTFTHYKNNPADSNSLANNSINDIEMDISGNLWIATKDGVDFLNVKTKIFTHFKDKAGEGSGIRSMNYAMQIHKDEKGDIWIGALTGGLYFLNKQRMKFENIPYQSNLSRGSGEEKVVAIIHDHAGRLYIGTDNGVYISDYSKQHFEIYASANKKIGNISGEFIRAMFYDPQTSLLWVGTENGGVNYLSKKLQPFQHYEVKKNGLSYKTIFGITEDNDNNIWVATFGGGVNVINKSTGSIQYYKHTEQPESLITDQVISIEKEISGNIWIGTYGMGLDLFDKKKKQFVHFNQSSDTTSLKGLKVYDIHIDQKGRTWVATDIALNLFHPETRSFSGYLPIQADPENPRNNSIRQIIDDGNGNLFTLSLESIQVFDIRTHTFSRFMEEMERKIEYMQCVFVDKKGAIWVGTSNGLFRVDKNRSSYAVFTVKDGLPSADIASILEDDKGNLWVSTKTNGLFKFNYTNHCAQQAGILFYSSDDGLQGREFISRTSYKSKDNVFYFGGQNGMNRFNPNDLLGNLHAPPVMLTSLKIFNKEVAIGMNTPLQHSISETKTITLSFKENIISLNFASLNYLSPQKNQYKYILENFEKDWNYVSNATTATYTNLNPGTYVFRVKASDNYGVWNDVGTSLTIIVTPPYWQTWWFITACAMFVLGTLIGAYKIRVRSMKGQKIKLEKLVHDRTESLVKLTEEEKLARQEAENLRAEADKANQAKSIFLATMSHEIRTPLNGVIGCTALLSETIQTEEQEKYTHMIRSSGENLLAVINDILDFSKIESGKMELDEHPFHLRDCIEDVLELFSGKASASGLDLIYQIATNVPLGLIGDSNRLKQVLTNLIGNAFKFTHTGEVFVNILLSHKDDKTAEILFEVRDTGTGIEEDKIGRLFKSFSQVDSSTTRKYGGTGLGLAISKLLVELMNGTIGVKSIKNKGTTFHFTIKTTIDQNTKRPSLPRNMDMLEGKRILVVDDNETNRTILHAQLAQWKMIPTLCSSAVKAIEKLNTHTPYDLIITDMHMPGMDGEQFAGKAKQISPETPIILFSSVGVEVKKYKELFVTKLNKPVRQTEFLQAIRKVFIKEDANIIQATSTSKLSVSFSEKYPLNILIAEDNQINQMLVTMTLKKLGYEPELAENGAIALKMLKEKNYNIVLMDVQMPVMDGLEATRQIRAIISNQPVIIAVTANAMKEDRDQCLNAGMDDYLTKPIQLDDLIKVLQKWHSNTYEDKGDVKS